MNRRPESTRGVREVTRASMPGFGGGARTAPDTIERIVRGKLCVRCGGCVAVCPPANVIRLDDESYPRVDLSGCIDCHLCLDVCPMHDVNVPELHRRYFGGESTPQQCDPVGPFINAYVAHSTDEQIRWEGSSGGVGVQLVVSLLEAGRIDAATAVVQHPQRPWDFVAQLARTREELLASSSSKYTIVPVNATLREFWKIGKRVAVVGLPCQVQSLRLWEQCNAMVRRNVEVCIGLFCTTTLTKQGSGALLDRLRIQPKQVAKIEYRRGEWPGGVHALLKDGRVAPLHQLDVKHGAYNYLSKTYFPKECLNCIDYCAELADIALADPWLRGPDGEFVYKGGWTLILTRTENGERTLHEVADSGALVLQPVDRRLFLRNFAPLAWDKRNHALWRITRLKRRGRPHPEFHVPEFERTFKHRLAAWKYAAERIVGMAEFTRRLYLYAGLSRPGVVISRAKAVLKRWKFRRRWIRRKRCAGEEARQ
jgi:coenzyme F420 hydrogenase subunit beta